jgi:hypothetical protein
MVPVEEILRLKGTDLTGTVYFAKSMAVPFSFVQAKVPAPILITPIPTSAITQGFGQLTLPISPIPWPEKYVTVLNLLYDRGSL